MTHRSVRGAPLVALVVAATFALASCASGDDGGGADAPTSTASATTATGPGSTTTTTAGSTRSSAPVVDAACAGTLTVPDRVPVQAPSVVEASGAAVSRQNDGVAWVHNDSGDTARVFALDEGTGGLRATVRLAGVHAVDWEDMALGPAVGDDDQPVDDRDALYLADIGDNAARRHQVALYRVDEPQVVEGEGADRARTSDIETYPFTYPDGPRDAEALFIDRTTDSFYVIAKRLSGGPVGIYRGPLGGWSADAGALPQLDRVGTYRPGPTTLAAVTGADMTPDGTAIAVRTYGAVHLYKRPEGADVADVLAGAPCDGPLPAEVQGEAVAFVPDGSAYVTIGEGTSPTLSFWRA